MACTAKARPALHLSGSLGDVTATLVVEEDPQAPVMELDGNGPMVFSVVRGSPDLTRISNERPLDIAKETTGQPLCDISPISGFPQYDSPMRYPGVSLNPVTCGECNECPTGTTWSPVYATMPVFTAMYQATDNPDTEDLYYVMDIREYAVSCSCQKIS